MNTEDFMLIGKNLGKWIVNFCPILKYQRKIGFLYKKFLKIIHDEALKVWLPFNQDRYLKKSYKKFEKSNDKDEPISLDDLGPSFEELEGIPITPESMESSISMSSFEEEVKIWKNDVQNKNNSILKEDIGYEPQNEVSIEEDEESTYSEFDNVINNVENFERNN